MAPSASQEPLAAIVHRGRSRPLRTIVILAVILALSGAGAFYYFQKSRTSGTSQIEYLTENAEIDRTISFIRLYQALGGGW